MEFTNELLKYIQKEGIIDLAYVQEQIEMQKKNKLLDKHPYKIWKGSDNKWHTYLPDEIKGRVPKRRNTKAEIEEIVINYWKEKQENPLVREIFAEWLDEKLAYGEISHSTYDRYLLDFNKYFKMIECEKITMIDEDFLETFIKRSIVEFNMTAKNFSSFRTLIYGIFKRAKKKKLVDFSISEAINDIEISRKAFKKVVRFAEDQVFNIDEKPLVEDYLEKNLDIINLGLLLMFKTGLRIGELATVKREEIKDYCIPIMRTETRYKGEDGKSHYDVKELPKTEAGIRLAIMPEKYKWIIDKILELNPDGEYLFEKSKKRIKTYSFRRRLRYICENKVHIKPKSPHKIRKTFGTILLNSGAKESTILETMGHSDILVTKDHYYFGRENLEGKRQELDAISEL